MTTITLETPTPTSTGRLEELVDRLLAALFLPAPTRQEPAASMARTIHEAQRLRQLGDLDEALAVLAEVDTANATGDQLRWLYAEWLGIARRWFAGDRQAVLYSDATGMAAVLVPQGDEDGRTLETAAVLGMRWPVGKLVSRRSLRGLKPLAKGGA